MEDLVNDYRKAEALFKYGEYDYNASLTPELDAEIEKNIELERCHKDAK
jgi:hypothetical protein